MRIIASIYLYLSNEFIKRLYQNSFWVKTETAETKEKLVSAGSCCKDRIIKILPQRD